ncbi:MAG: hypothetical protein J4F37_11515 [Acidobacteria bacterium]|nr:hypothetical protein [Acidobacteriota bacterium]
MVVLVVVVLVVVVLAVVVLVVVVLVVVVLAVIVVVGDACRALARPVRVPLDAAAELQAEAAEIELLVGEGRE